MKTFDAIVVGGGSIGCPTSFFLAESGLKVLVLERCASVGQGENKAAIGGVRATHSDAAKILICTESLKVFTTWEERHGYSIGWKPGGYCFPVFTENTEASLKGMLPIQKSFGLVIDWVGPDEIKEIIPGINPHNLRGGTYSPNDGQVSPILSSVAFQREAEKLGAEFHLKERVTGYKVEDGKIKGVSTEKDTYYAPEVVIATGAEASEHGDFLGIKIPVTPDSHEAGITAPLEHFLKPLVVDLRPGPEGKTANFYFGQNHEGQIIFCYTPKELFVGTNKENTSEFLPTLAGRMINLLPRMRSALIRRIWRGCYPMTPDGLPIIDRVDEISGLTLAVGMCGQGFMLGPGVGENVASLVTKGKTLLPQEVNLSLRFHRDFYKSKKELLK